jgi:hypothetical protein
MLKGKPQFGFVVTALLLTSTSAFPATAPKLSGSIAGIVRDAAGIPQMGATVLLFNKYEKLLQRALTNERGAFGFDTLNPDIYSIRVSLSSFLPAMKHKIAVQPGMQSLLYINMANMLSSIELVYAAPGQGALMSDDWRWTLKTATSTRPIMRFGPQIAGISQSPDPERSGGSVFSDTRGLVKVSAGDAGTLAGSSDQQDLGTAFALATSLFGRNQLQVSGNVGYGLHTGLPTAGFRTTYSREGMTPEVSVTMRQIYLPTHAGIASTTTDGLPALRSVSVATVDRIALTPDLSLDYGISLDSVSFGDHLNYYSPFARFTYDLGKLGAVQFGYSSGAPPTELATYGNASTNSPGGASDSVGLSENLTALAQIPRVSMRNDRVKVQRTQNFEIGYEKVLGNRTFNVSGYREIVSNGALTMMSPDGLFQAGDVLPDLSSDSSIVNIGGYERYGYAASLTQRIGGIVEVSGSAGRTGVLTLGEQDIAFASAEGLRSTIRNGQRFWGSARASATLPHAETQITTTYEWTDYSALMPTHYYITQKAYPEPGLNIRIRQPIPVFSGLPGRLEANVDLRNILAQGYLPVTVAGRRVMMMQNARALRGGLSFIF